MGVDTAGQAVVDHLAGDACPPPATSPARRSLSQFARISQLEDVRAIADATVAAALDVVPLDSAVLVRSDRDGALEVVSCAGPLGGALGASPQYELAALAAQARKQTSCFVIGSPAIGPDRHRRQVPVAL